MIATTFCLTFVLGSTAFAAEVPAFPGAEGFGAHTPGGRGGRVVLVTSLADSGPGTLRAACEAKGPRIVVFRVSGLIELESTLDIRNPYITIAGQSAPGDGICLRNYPLRFTQTHDFVVRHVRVRPGDTSRQPIDAISVGGCRDFIFDHCSASWSIDEVFSANRGCKDCTVQWCLISEALHNSHHPKGVHGYGSLISSFDGGITMHHNLYAHNTSRNPRGGGPADPPGARLDFRNNLVYDWGIRAGYTGHDERVRINYVGNYLKPGPSTYPEMRTVAWHVADPRNKLYLLNNRIEGAPEKDHDNWLMVAEDTIATAKANGQQPVFANGDVCPCRMTAPFPAPSVATTSAEVAYRQILAGAGATLPKRDAVDARVVAQVRHGTGRHIDSQEEVGGWPQYRVRDAEADSDSDGIPDTWERRHGYNPHDALDNREDADDDGYQTIEEFLNGTDPRSHDTNRRTDEEKATGEQSAGTQAAIPLGH